MKVISLLPALQLICFIALFLANATRLLKGNKELNLIPALTTFTLLVIISYSLYLIEYFIAWYGKNEYESFALESHSWALIAVGSLFSLMPLTGWINSIRDRPLIYTLLMATTAIWTLTSYLGKSTIS